MSPCPEPTQVSGWDHDPKGMQKKVATRNSDFSGGDERTRSKL